MSVIVIGKIQGDTAKFQQSLADRGDEFAKIVESSRAAGAIHHRFGVGDGHVELRHRILQLLACYPDPGRQQGDHSGVARRRQTGDSRHDRGPIGCGP